MSEQDVDSKQLQPIHTWHFQNIGDTGEIFVRPLRKFLYFLSTEGFKSYVGFSRSPSLETDLEAKPPPVFGSFFEISTGVQQFF